MKRIQCLSELLEIKQKIQQDLAEYLEEEFIGLYDYLSNGEQVDEFVLEPHQAMLLLEKKEELDKLQCNYSDMEFMEEVKLKSSTLYRIGILNAEDIQLCYKIK